MYKYVAIIVLLMTVFFYSMLYFPQSTPSHHAGNDLRRQSTPFYHLHTVLQRSTPAVRTDRPILRPTPLHQVGTSAQLGTSTLGPVSKSASSTSKSPPLMCDEECRRFRRLLDAWPADKPKGAVVTLLEGPSSFRDFARSSRLFSANFNNAYDYPVIVFHEENLNNDTYRQQLRSFTNSSLYFQVPCTQFRVLQ